MPATPSGSRMLNSDVISMPDKLLGVSLVRRMGPGISHGALSLVDFDFAKEQLLLMLRNLYAHPNGQIPAYE